MITDVKLLVDAHAEVGEGAIWDDVRQVLYWVDIMRGHLFAYDPAPNVNRKYELGKHVGTIVPSRTGVLLVALVNGFAQFDPATEKLTLIADPEAHLTNNRFNDGKCDPAGRFWAGTMAYSDQKDQGSLYCLDSDLRVRKMESGLGIANGIVWSHDHKTMYYIDTNIHEVRAYDYDLATGNIGNRRRAITLPPEIGMPDGMTIDADGLLWIAFWQGSAVHAFDPLTGKRVESVQLPVTQVTSCAFGGPNLDTLFITSAASGLDAAALQKQPLAGALFACQPGRRGVKAFRFAN